MRLLLALSATAIASVQAFSDTSPFLFLSSSSLPELSRQKLSVQLGSRDYVLNKTKSILSECPSEVYYVVTHPSLSAHKSSNIIQALDEMDINTRFSVSEAIGLQKNDGHKITQYIEERCGAKKINGVALSDIEGRKEKGESLIVVQTFNDNVEESEVSLTTNMLSQIKKRYEYSIILVTTPAESDEGFQDDVKDLPYESLHTELKRGMQVRAHNISADADLRPLFEKYQFLSPGLFAGIFVTVILVAILSVGISAISSLEVSYGAFDKEIGPSGSKKQ